MKLSFSRLQVIQQLLYLPILVIFFLGYFFAPIRSVLAQGYVQCYCYCDGSSTKCVPIKQNVKDTTEAVEHMKKCQAMAFNGDCRFGPAPGIGGSCSCTCNDCKVATPADMKKYTLYCCRCGSGPTGSDHCVEQKYEVTAANLTDAKNRLSGVTNCSETQGGDKRCAINVPEPKPIKPPISIPIADPGSVGKIIGDMNPFTKGGGLGGKCSGNNLTIGCILGLIINEIVFPLAVIFFTLMIVWGGYKIVAGGMSGSQNQVSAGKQRLIGAILGLLLLASVYWIWQLIEYLTNIKVVG